MRTALILLALLCLSAVIAGLVPQRPNVPERAESFLKGTVPWLHPVLDRLGLFDVYGAVWFQAIVVLLIVVLLACLLPRTRALLRNGRALRRPPTVGPFPSSGRRTVLETSLAAPEARALARRVLRRRLYRLSPANEAGQFVAERGFAREAGSLVFHWSFLVLIVGVVLTQGFGLRGAAIVVEGEDWVDTPATYASYRPGRFWTDDRHHNFVVHVEDFDVSFRDDGSPADFVTHAKVLEGGREVRDQLIRVNSPLAYGGLKFYQFDWGWAPVLRVSHHGAAIYEGPVVLQRGRGPCGAARGALRFPGVDPPVAFHVDFYSDLVFVDRDVPGCPREPGLDRRPANFSDQLRAPLLILQAFTGPSLRDPVPTNVYLLDDTGLQPFDAGTLVSGKAAIGGLDIELIELRTFTLLGIKGDPGVPVVGVAGSLILVGLVPSLLSWRRRLWVHVVSRDNATTLVQLGGVAYQRKDRFDEEFTQVALRLRRQLPPVLDVERELVP